MKSMRQATIYEQKTLAKTRETLLSALGRQ
jgi:hypothetical protein